MRVRRARATNHAIRTALERELIVSAIDYDAQMLAATPLRSRIATPNSVAGKLGIRITAVPNLPTFDYRLHARRAGLEHAARRSVGQIDTILSAYRDAVLAGASDAQIAERCGASVDQVRAWRRRMRLQVLRGRKPKSVSSATVQGALERGDEAIRQAGGPKLGRVRNIVWGISCADPWALLFETTDELVAQGVPRRRVAAIRHYYLGHTVKLARKWSAAVGLWGGVATKTQIAAATGLSEREVENYAHGCRLKYKTRTHSCTPAALGVRSWLDASSPRAAASSLGVLPVERQLLGMAIQVVMDDHAIDIHGLLTWPMSRLEGIWPVYTTDLWPGQR